MVCDAGRGNPQNAPNRAHRVLSAIRSAQDLCHDDAMPVEPSIPAMPEPGEIHVWTVPCSGGDEAADELLACLSERERQRTARMTVAEARSAFVIGRARVRQILGGYIAQPPAALDVVARENGKPVLAGAPPWFDFSFSRCARLHVCAVAVNRRVGTDVELVGLGRDANTIASTYFARDERAWLAACAAPERATALAALWVKKEAFIKAMGTRLRLPPDAYRVPLEAEGWVEGPASDADAERAVRWRVCAFTPAAPQVESGAVVGAVVAEGDWRLTVIPWPGPTALQDRSNAQTMPRRAHTT